jgi:hypothetical protein
VIVPIELGDGPRIAAQPNGIRGRDRIKDAVRRAAERSYGQQQGSTAEGDEERGTTLSQRTK